MTELTGGSADPGHTPRLSVTVLNHNYGHFLKECLDSILSQSFENFELLVIDDCSSDNSLDVIGPFLRDRRVRLITHATNSGFVQSLVEGVRLSAAPFITVVSADDLVLDPTAFERQMGLLESNPETAFCYSAWQFVDTTESGLSRQEPFTVKPFADDHVWAGETEFRRLCAEYYVLHTGTIIRKAAYEAVGGYDESVRYTIDIAMWTLLCGAGEVAYIARPLYGYRVHGSNMSRDPAVLRATVDELLRMVELSFARLPAGQVKSDRRLLRRARRKALANVSSMEILGGRIRAGWRVHAHAVRLRPADAIFQRQLASMVMRTLLGGNLFSWLVKGVRNGRSAASRVPLAGAVQR